MVCALQTATGGVEPLRHSEQRGVGILASYFREFAAKYWPFESTSDKSLSPSSFLFKRINGV
jgi:hypothetical protein